MSLYYLANYRYEDQLEAMRRLEEEGVCIFCPSGSTHRVIVHRTEHWSVTPNAFPYRGTQLHLLLIPDEHVTDLVDLSAAAQQDFWEVLRWAREEHALRFYGLAVRNGLSEFTGGTIRHLHAHLVQGDPAAPDPVRVKLSSSPSPSS